MLNLETITPEQREEIQELVKADSEKAFNRMFEIFQETTKRQQEIINQLTEENKELKEKLAKLENERQEVSGALDEAEKMTEEYNRQKDQWEQEEEQQRLEFLEQDKILAETRSLVLEANKTYNLLKK